MKYIKKMNLNGKLNKWTLKILEIAMTAFFLNLETLAMIIFRAI
jgi:hypothetical protein